MEKRVALFEVKELKGEDPNGSFEAILSVPVVDRDGEVVAAGAFNPLPAEIPIHRFHDFSSPVATAAPFYDGDILKAKGVFDPDADSQVIRSKVGRSIRYMSVGFMAASREEIDGVPTITRAELLEASFVSVPANREAAILAVKQAYPETMTANSAPNAEVTWELTTTIDPAVAAKEISAYLKAGRTLSAKNESSLRQAVTMINEVLEQLGDDQDASDGKAVTDPEGDAAPAASPPADVMVKHLPLLAEVDLLLLDEPTGSRQGAHQ